MRISRIKITNFRNFAHLDVKLGKHAVIVGENKIGKSNFLFALRLLLDPSLPDIARRLKDEDFWDGMPRPLTTDDRITISVDITDFENNESILAVLAEHLVEPTPMVARLTYVWQSTLGPGNRPTRSADYEFVAYGGDRPENRIDYDLRRRIPFELIPALRDCENDLERWSRSPLRPLLDKAADAIDREKLLTLAKGVDAATEELAKVDEVKRVSLSIANKLHGMVGSTQALETLLRFSPADPDKLIRALRLFIDGGKRGIADASLGSANLLYFAMKSLENDQLVADGDRDHTILAIEEPEAHLHPNLQRLIFRNYLRPREGEEPHGATVATTILMTTHSPHIASVAPIKDFVVLRRNKAGNGTEAVSTANLDLSATEISDLERYIDVNRGEILFARGIILVEGDAERFLVPVLARLNGYDLDELGISVCSVSGTNFAPFLKLLGPLGLDLPFAVLTDMDPQAAAKDGEPRDPLGEARVVNEMLEHLVDRTIWEKSENLDILKMATEQGVFLNDYTLEVDLFRSGLHLYFAQAMQALGASKAAKKRMREWSKQPNTLNINLFLKDINRVGKGRFAQRLASVMVDSKSRNCPDYILDGISHVKAKCDNK